VVLADFIAPQQRRLLPQGFGQRHTGTRCPRQVLGVPGPEEGGATANHPAAQTLQSSPTGIPQARDVTTLISRVLKCPICADCQHFCGAGTETKAKPVTRTTSVEQLSAHCSRRASDDSHSLRRASSRVVITHAASAPQTSQIAWIMLSSLGGQPAA